MYNSEPRTRSLTTRSNLQQSTCSGPSWHSDRDVLASANPLLGGFCLGARLPLRKAPFVSALVSFFFLGIWLFSTMESEVPMWRPNSIGPLAGDPRVQHAVKLPELAILFRVLSMSCSGTRATIGMIGRVLELKHSYGNYWAFISWAFM